MSVPSRESRVVLVRVAPGEGGRVLGDPAKDRVREPGGLRPDRLDELDALVHGRAVFGVQEEDLVRGDPQGVSYPRLEPLAAGVAVDRLVQSALGLQRAVCEPGGERGIVGAQSRALQRRRENLVAVGGALAHAREHLARQPSCR